ncbi:MULTISPECIES: hypothetical protein [unclassified Mesorhizobium]|uniref:hypothetical protein n=1 Tax=unclassified Mesorhizobium TaxID=325217 RepID=UPI00333CDBD4
MNYSKPFDAEPESAAEPRRRDMGIIYVKSGSGHRQSYADLLGPALGLAPAKGPMSRVLKKRLLAADRLFFATLDDDLVSFVSIALRRAALGRATVALFLGPQSCFGPFNLKRLLKKGIFVFLRRVPKVTVASIIPLSLAPEYGTVVDVGLHDPQWWDMHDGHILRQPGDTPVATEVRHLAGGRPIVCWLGAASVHKGFAFMVAILEANPAIAKRLCFVTAGTANSEQALVSRFKSMGGIHIDRRLTDAEWESLYGVADAVWACYDPRYDQASGVFGRALQFGVPAIVRRSSLIHTAATKFGAPVHAIDFGDCNGAATELNKIAKADRGTATTEEREIRIRSWRNDFISSTMRALEGSKHTDAELCEGAA